MPPLSIGRIGYRTIRLEKSITDLLGKDTEG